MCTGALSSEPRHKGPFRSSQASSGGDAGRGGRPDLQDGCQALPAARATRAQCQPAILSESLGHLKAPELESLVPSPLTADSITAKIN